MITLTIKKFCMEFFKTWCLMFWTFPIVWVSKFLIPGQCIHCLSPIILGQCMFKYFDWKALSLYYFCPPNKYWSVHHCVDGKVCWPVFFIYLDYTFKSSKRTIIVLYEDDGKNKVMVVTAGDIQNPLKNVKYVMQLNWSCK